jgi:hypothetical protein
MISSSTLGSWIAGVGGLLATLEAVQLNGNWGDFEGCSISLLPLPILISPQLSLLIAC